MIKEKIKKIISGLDKKYSMNCWFNKKGKLIFCGSDSNFRKLLVKEKKKYKNSYIIEIKLEINGSGKENKLKQRKDIILITATVKKVLIRDIGVSLEKRNDNYSILEIMYNYRELDKFNISDLKYIAILAYKGIYEEVFHKDDYKTFNEIEKKIKKLK